MHKKENIIRFMNKMLIYFAKVEKNN